MRITLTDEERKMCQQYGLAIYNNKLEKGTNVRMIGIKL